VAAALAASQPNYAWSLQDTAVALPAYIHWEFTCGDAGDFESLARSMVEKPVPLDFGTRPLDLGLAGAGMPATSSTRTTFRGALTAPNVPQEAAWPDPGDPDQVAVDAALAAEIDKAAAMTAASGGTRPAIGPLLYARAASSRSVVTTASPSTDWFDQLNRDPRKRAVAGLASRVLRRNIEDVIARAWQQVGRVDEANGVLRRLQVSRTVSTSIHVRHLSNLPAGRMLAASRPLLHRVVLPAETTGGTGAPDALAALAASAFPAGATWRGVTAALRLGTRIGDRAAQSSGTDAGTPGSASARYVAGLANGLPEPSATPDGTGGLAAPSSVLGSGAADILTAAVRAAASSAGLTVPAAGSPQADLIAGADALVAGASTRVEAAATNLSAETGVVLRNRALPASVSFSQVNGVLVGGNATAGGTAPSPSPSPSPVSVVALTTQARSLAVPVPMRPLGRPVPVSVVVRAQDPRLKTMRDAYAGAIDSAVRPGTSTPLPVPIGLDADRAGAALLDSLHPTATIAKLAKARVPELADLNRLDPVAPVMVGPVFPEAAYTALVAASHDAFVPGLDGVPDDSVTLVQTNPSFVAAYLAGLNSALGHELLWRGYPTDERGTYWHSFWSASAEIGPLHLFHGGLADNVTSGSQPLLVLVLRGKLLRRYPNTDIYVMRAGSSGELPDIDDAHLPVWPIFRDFVAPDISLVGFPLTYDQVVGTAGEQSSWFVLAEHPGQPRFGLVDSDSALANPLPSWDELSWANWSGSASATYPPTEQPSASPATTTRVWARSSADNMTISFQPAVRVGIRATTLLPTKPVLIEKPNGGGPA
jgi:hypothetical protein